MNVETAAGGALRIVDDQDSQRLRELYDAADETDHVRVGYSTVSPDRGAVTIVPQRRRRSEDCSCSSGSSLVEWAAALAVAAALVYKFLL